MNEVTISTNEYAMLIENNLAYNQLRKLLEKKLAESQFIYSGDCEVIGFLFGIEVKKDA